MFEDLEKIEPLILDATTKAAIACYNWIGKEDQTSADQAAVDAMRSSLNNIAIDGTVVIGEGERDQAPMLYIGERLGKGGPALDIALDPLEGTKLCAYNTQGALSVIAVAPKGGLLGAPDVYMNKIAAGPNLPKDVVTLIDSPKTNLSNLALAKKCNISDLKVTILDRPRHEELIAKTKEAGAQVKLIGDGDIAAIIEAALPNHIADLYMGIGGAPEGVLAASALQSIGGQMMGQLLFDNNAQEERAKKMGISDLTRIYLLDDMVSKDSIFIATGITSGSLVKGIKFKDGKAITNSLILNSQSHMARTS